MTFLDQLFLETEIILDNTVVDNDDFSGAIAMRMRVFFCGPAVSGPTRVADAVSAFKRLLTYGLFQIAQFVFAMPQLQPVPMAANPNSRRVVAPILQPP